MGAFMWVPPFTDLLHIRVNNKLSKTGRVLYTSDDVSTAVRLRSDAPTYFCDLPNGKGALQLRNVQRLKRMKATGVTISNASA